MKPFIFFIIGCMSLLLEGCSNPKPSENQEAPYESVLKDCPVVAHYQVINGDSVLVCDFTAMKEKRNIPISSLLSSYEIVALDTCKDILSSPNWGRAAISPHYIGVKAMEEPLRLFDRKTGKFLHAIGGVGRGPAEYLYTIGFQIEEDSNTVLLGAPHPARIIRYELSTGKYQKEYNLLFSSPDNLYCDLKKQEITGLGYPFPPYEDEKRYFWKQTFDARLIQGITGREQVGFNEHNRGVGHLDNRSNSYHVFLWQAEENQQDTLYHYDIEKNRLIPRFTIRWGEQIPTHSFIDLPHYYYCEILGSDNYIYPCLIDKHTGQGASIKLTFDMFGKRPDVGRLTLHNYDSYGIYILLDPLQIADELTPEEQQKRIAGRIMNPDSLQSENSWVFIGNWQ